MKARTDRLSPGQQGDIDGGLRAGMGEPSLPGGRKLPELRSALYQEVIGAPPPFAVHSGALTAAIITACLLLAAAVLPYPVVIASQVQLVSTPMPAPLLSHASGRIEQLQLADGSAVTAGQLLAVVDDGDDAAQIIALRKWLAEIPLAIDPGTVLPPPPVVTPARLGRCEPAFAAAVQALEDVHNFATSHPRATQLAQLHTEALIDQTITGLLQQKRHAADAASSAAQEQVRSQKVLVTAGLASPAYLDNGTEQLQMEKEQDADTKIAMLANELAVLQTEEQAQALRTADEVHQQDIVDQLANALNALRQAVSAWESAHEQRAPQAGTLRLFHFWANDQKIDAGDEFALIVPQRQHVLGVAYIPAWGFGEVRVGDPALVAMDADPAAQFGWLPGRVSAISSVAIGGTYRVLIALPQGLLTSRGNRLSFSENMGGGVRIRVRSMSILRHLLIGLSGAAIDSSAAQ
jgi:multidrug resistance efflux pump